MKADVDEVAILRASAALPQARLTYLETEVCLKVSEREFQRIAAVETRNVTEERVDARRSLIEEFFARRDIGAVIAEQIHAL